MTRECRYCGEQIELDEDGDYESTEHLWQNPFVCKSPTSPLNTHQPAELETPLLTNVLAGKNTDGS